MTWNYDMDAAPRDKPIMVAATGFCAGVGVVEWDIGWSDGWWMCDDGKQSVELPLRGPAPYAWKFCDDAPPLPTGDAR